MLTTTPNALLLIKAWEGLKTQAYFDSVGVPTIGFGTTVFHNGDKVLPGDEITEDEAEAELFHHIRKEVEPALDAHFKDVPLQPNQRDALASFIYNLGGNSEKWPTLKSLISDEKPTDEIADQWMKYTRAGGKVLTGLYRRRMAEVLVWLGWAWDKATEVSQSVEVGDDWREVAGFSSEPMGEVDAELFEELEIPRRGVESPQPKPEAVMQDPPLTTEDLNARELAKLKKVAITPITKKVPVEAVDYLEDEDKTVGNITVKPIESSQRGKGYKNAELGKTIGVVTVAGMAAEQAGAVEPVIKFVDKYSFNTIAMVFGAMLLLSVGLYYYGKWQRQKGEDEATDLLG